jgi:uncharacterized protein (DUF1810 family)
MTDRHDLQRFLDAQAPVYAAVCDELRVGRKRSHWMWYIFPQLQGLGASPMAQRYAIASLDEAKAYLAHPVLGARLRECASLVAGIEGRSVGDIFGYPDDMKFRSSMTLFSRAAPDEAVFADCLEKYFDSEPDRLTLDSLPRA